MQTCGERRNTASLERPLADCGFERGALHSGEPGSGLGCPRAPMRRCHRRKKSMKKIGALITVAMLSGQASGQGNVSIFGIVDGGLRYVTNAAGSHQYSLSGGNESANRIGFMGSEDLGNGLKAVFLLENGFNIGNGTESNGVLFSRQAYAGLSGSAGTLTLGRQYLTLSTVMAQFESGTDWAARGSGYGYHPGGLDDVDGTERANNSIKYTSNNLYGFQVGVTYGFGEAGGSVRQNHLASAGLSYAGGPFSFAVASLYADSPNFSLFGNTPANNAPTATNALNVTSPVFTGFASARSQQVDAAGASYKAGPAIFACIVTNTRMRDIGGTVINGNKPNPALVGASATLRTGELSVRYLTTRALTLSVAYAYTGVDTTTTLVDASYRQLSLGANYSLSKLTDLYLVALNEKAAGIDSTGKAAVAAMTFAKPSTSNAQTALMLGIRKLF
jgi:predicted porin